MNREELINWLCANDSNGVYRDEDSTREGMDVLTYEGAYELYLKQLEGWKYYYLPYASGDARTKLKFRTQVRWKVARPTM